MTKRNVTVTIHSEQTGAFAGAEDFDFFDNEEEYPDGEYDEDDEEEGAEEEPEAQPADPNQINEPQVTDLLLEGRLVTTTNRVELLYEENVMSGMDGTVTKLTFDRACPGFLTLTRSGVIHSAMVFEQGRRHICVYHAPFVDLDICVKAKRVVNRLLEDGTLYLDYYVEMRGAEAEHCKLTLSIADDA